MSFIRIGNLIDGKDVGYWCKAYVEERKKNDEWEASFDLYDRAMLRGTKLWQEETGNDEVPRIWPDGAKLAAWLMSKLDTAKDAMETTALSMDLRAGKKIDVESYERVLKKYGGAMAASYIKICEALGEATKNEEEADAT